MCAHLSSIDSPLLVSMSSQGLNQCLLFLSAWQIDQVEHNANIVSTILAVSCGDVSVVVMWKCYILDLFSLGDFSVCPLGFVMEFGCFHGRFTLSLPTCSPLMFPRILEICITPRILYFLALRLKCAVRYHAHIFYIPSACSDESVTLHLVVVNNE